MVWCQNDSPQQFHYTFLIQSPIFDTIIFKMSRVSISEPATRTLNRPPIHSCGSPAGSSAAPCRDACKRLCKNLKGRVLHGNWTVQTSGSFSNVWLWCDERDHKCTPTQHRRQAAMTQQKTSGVGQERSNKLQVCMLIKTEEHTHPQIFTL